MPRKEVTVHIVSAGRDRDKVFHITEMSASRAEDWAVRLFLALARSGVEIPDDIASAGLAGIAFLSLNMLGSVRYDDAAPLMREMMECVKIIPDPRQLAVMRPLIEDDIEEVRTRMELRSHVIELHTGFSVADALLKGSTPAPSADSSSTRMSLAQ